MNKLTKLEQFKLQMDSLESLFDNIDSNIFIGFDDYFKNTRNIITPTILNNSNYPPYNIYKKNINISTGNGACGSALNEEHTFIELACAGIKKENLKVTLTPDNVLTIKTDYNLCGRDGSKDIKYSFQGIAHREFMFTRTLQPNMKIVKVSYVDGILLVELRTAPATDPKTYEVDID